MRILLDTNLLLRMSDSLHPLHPLAISAVDTLRRNHHDLVIVPQNIYEFWSVATRSIAANGMGQPPAFASAFAAQFCSVFRLLRDERAIYEMWLDLVNLHQINGVKSYDARLAAAMSRHGITHILTFNAGDFRRYSHITLIDPLTV
jgi:predicted nucleic acid-binding protein